MSAEWQRIQEADRVRREQEAARRTQAVVELEENATPETLRHRRACVMDELFNRGNLTPEQYRAGQEICALWVKITSGLWATVQKYERQPAGVGHTDWQAGLIRAYHERYVPWREEAGKIPVKQYTLADLTFKIVVDNYGCQQVASAWHMHRDRVKQLTRVSLQRYAEIGQWVDHCGRSINAA
jgi:hypothetical protein